MEVGGVFSHWFESVTPLASCAHAVIIAVRCASSRVCAAPVRQSLRPLKVMQTRQRCGCDLKVESAMTPSTRNTNRSAIQVVGLTPRRLPAGCANSDSTQEYYQERQAAH